jgi:hypothetical protein
MRARGWLLVCLLRVQCAEEAESMKKKPTSEQHERLLYSRERTAHALDCSVQSLIRYEHAGLLKAVKLGGRKASKTFYTAASVHRLAKVEESAA